MQSGRQAPQAHGAQHHHLKQGLHVPGASCSPPGLSPDASWPRVVLHNVLQFAAHHCSCYCCAAANAAASPLRRELGKEHMPGFYERCASFN